MYFFFKWRSVFYSSCCCSKEAWFESFFSPCTTTTTKVVLLILGQVNLKLDMSLNNAFVPLSPYSRIVGE